MSKKKWLWILLACLALAGTHALAYFCGRYGGQTKPFMDANFQIRESQESGRKVFVGVAMPDELLSGDGQKDLDFAKSYLSNNRQSKFLVTGKVPFLENYTGFGFAPIAPQEMAMR